jgi:hypothetical protein
MNIPFLPSTGRDDPMHLVMDVTPEMAAAWLTRNHFNRQPPSANRIASYKRFMENGEWATWASHLSFSTDGLIDGQHRLMALAQMPPGTVVKMSLFINIPASAAQSMDGGWGRTLAHRTLLSKDIIALVQWMDKVTTGGARTLSPSEAQSYYARHQESVNWVLEHRGKNGFCRTQYRLAMVWLYERAEHTARDFFDVFHGIQSAELDDPAMVLRNKVSSWAKVSPPIFDIYAYAMTAVTAAMDGRPLQCLKKSALGGQKW